MSNHIHFSCIECDALSYDEKIRAYKCALYGNLKDTTHCMRCKFDKQKDREKLEMQKND